MTHRNKKGPLSRSEQMSHIKGKDTDPEVTLRRALWARGLRYRLHATTPACRPDIVFPTRQVAVFVDGCFWHGCPQHYPCPRSNEDFWSNKLASNVGRDARQSAALADAGWSVVRVWEHEVIEELDNAVARVVEAICGEGDDWRHLKRVLRVVALGDGRERRELVELVTPTLVVSVHEGPRITDKARPRARRRLRR